jgi:cytosine/adenosine deaminase-related metal-dependent hydrolase
LRTVIRGGWVVGFGDSGHELIRDGVVVIDDDKVAEVGAAYDGHADLEIDARQSLVSPGCIDLHVHPGTSEKERIISDTGRPMLMGLPFQEYSISPPGKHAPGDFRYDETVDQNAAPTRFSALFTQTELLRNGITTFLDAGTRVSFQKMNIEVARDLGTRAYLAPGYQSSMMEGTNDGRMVRDRVYSRGKQEFADAVEFAREYDGALDGRIRTGLYPRETDFCDEAQLRATRAAADELGVVIQTHAAYSPQDFYYVVEEYGCTPIELLDRTGLLGPDLSIAHPIFLGETDLVMWQQGRDIDLLAASGTVGVWTPIVWSRRGYPLDFRRLVDAGVTIAMGTDAYPRDMIINMRMGLTTAKMENRSVTGASCAELFTAATLGGARGLNRDDLGRLAAGAKADIAIITLRGRDTLRWGTIYDPIRSLVETGVGDDVETVLVDGVVRMRDRRIPGIDYDELLDRVQSDAERYWSHLEEWDALGRTVEEACPPSFPIRNGRSHRPMSPES